MSINPKVVSDRFDNEVVVVNLENGFYYSFRDTAAEIWNRLEQGNSSEAIEQACEEVPAGEQSKIREFFTFLENEHLVSPAAAGSRDGDSTETVTPYRYTELTFSKFEDMADLIMIDPIHEIDPKKGWPEKPS